MLQTYVLVLALLAFAPPSAAAQQWGQPVPIDGKCTVAADERWKPQEKFVWERVCAGRLANFNAVDGYGGNLDPRKSTALPDNRILSPAFLEAILLNDKYRHVLTRRGVRIIGARFTDALDLSNAELQHELWLDGSLFEKGIDLAGVKSKQLISIEGAKVVGNFYGMRLQVDSSLYLRGSELEAIDLGSARVGGTLEISNKARVTGRLNMDKVQVALSLFLNDNSEFQEVNLVGARVGGVLDLSEKTKVRGPLKMGSVQVASSVYMRDNCEFADVNLGSAHIGGTLELNTKTKVTGQLNMDKVHVASSLFMRDGSEFKEVNLVSAQIAGMLDLSRSSFGGMDMEGARIGGTVDMSDKVKIAGTLDMSATQVAASVYMHNGSQFKTVDLGSARIGGTLALSTSEIAGRVNMDKVSVASSLYLRDAKLSEVNLTSGHIGGMLDFERANVSGSLILDKVQVASALYMRNAQFKDVNLDSARIAGLLSLFSSKIQGDLSMDNVQVSSPLEMSSAEVSGEVNLEGAHIAGSLDFRKSKINGKLRMENLQVDQAAFLSSGADFAGPVQLSFAKIGHLDLAGAKFEDNVDLTGTQILGELRVGSSPQNPSQWSDKMTLILRNVRADSIQDLSQAWPQHLELSGFMYRNIGGIAGAKDSMANRTIEWFKDWLGRQQFYSSAPYEHLATVLRGQGRQETADEILFERKERERSAAQGVNYLALTSSKWFIGYGYHLEWVRYWILGVLILGVLVLRFSGEGARNGMPYGIAYSFDMLLPIVRLREEHYKTDLRGFARYYFYGHKILGYVLASFLIAGISGVTK